MVITRRGDLQEVRLSSELTPETIEFTLNGRPARLDIEPNTPLLWVLRDELTLTGTKFGCGKGVCGACTGHMDGSPIRSCAMPVSAIAGKRITTIEGLSANGDHPLQRAWVAENAPQCGYCQSGQIMSAAALLANTPDPTDEDINAAMSGNICRCGTYPRIRKAIKRAAKDMQADVATWEPAAAGEVAS
jgi:aerobic-type carbon monoxide dehydrogenase small subunit (CoxS/CutS family)